jgi:hypothetical protein
MNVTEELVKPKKNVSQTTVISQDSIPAMLNMHERVGTEKPTSGVFQRAIGILTQPEETWKKIAKEEGGLLEAFVPYTFLTELVPSLIGSVMGLGYSSLLVGLYGYGAGVGTLTGSLFHVAQSYASSVIGILVVGKVMEIVAPQFGARQSWVLSCRVLIYAATPAALCSALWFLPFVNILAGWGGSLWSLVLFFQGYRILLKEKSTVPIRSENQN